MNADENKKLKEENLRLLERLSELKTQIIQLSNIMAIMEYTNQEEIAKLRRQIADQVTAKISIFGYPVGCIIQKFPRSNGKIKEIPCWYAYAKGNKKIYLGSGDFDKEKFESKLTKKGYTPLTTTQANQPMFIGDL